MRWIRSTTKISSLVSTTKLSWDTCMYTRILGADGTPFWGKGRSQGSAMTQFERAMVVSYRLSIATVALSVTFGRNWRSNVGGSLRAKISWCFPWSRPLMFGSAESEHPRLTNLEIISEEFQPMWSQSTNVTDRQTDGQTDRRHAIARPRFALKCIAR